MTDEDAASTATEADTDTDTDTDDTDTDAATGTAAEELDVDAERARLDGVEAQIEEGRRALADLEQETDPQPDGPPVAAGEGAANAPPG